MRTRRLLTLGLVLATIAIATSILALTYLERERTVQGVWVWQFEGSAFYEGASAGNACTAAAGRGAWLNLNPRQIYGRYDYRKEYPSSGFLVEQDVPYRIEAFHIKFRGRERFSFLGTGHMGAWRTEFEAAKLISAKPLPGLICGRSATL